MAAALFLVVGKYSTVCIICGRWIYGKQSWEIGLFYIVNVLYLEKMKNRTERQNV